MRIATASVFYTLLKMHRGKGDKEVRWHVERLPYFFGDFPRLRKKRHAGERPAAWSESARGVTGTLTVHRSPGPTLN